MARTAVRILTFATAATLAAACRTKAGAGDDLDASSPTAATATQTAGVDAKGAKTKGPAATHSWEDGAGSEWRYFTKKMNWDEASSKCDAMAKSTKKRWRMPSPGELADSLKKGISSSKNPSFGWVYLNQTWSASWETVVGAKVAVYVDMGNGKQFRTSVDHMMSALCVLTTDAQGTNDTWTDGKTGQVWRLAGDEMDWATADKTCRSIARNERLPWRMATIPELEAAVKHGILSNANAAFGKEFLTLAWSADASPSFGSESLALDLRNGNQYLMAHDQHLAALCIRPLNH